MPDFKYCKSKPWGGDGDLALAAIGLADAFIKGWDVNIGNGAQVNSPTGGRTRYCWTSRVCIEVPSRVEKLSLVSTIFIVPIIFGNFYPLNFKLPSLYISLYTCGTNMMIMMVMIISLYICHPRQDFHENLNFPSFWCSFKIAFLITIIVLGWSNKKLDLVQGVSSNCLCFIQRREVVLKANKLKKNTFRNSTKENIGSIGAVHILRQPKSGVPGPPLPPLSAFVSICSTPLLY